MYMTKIAFIGAGSLGFTAGLVRDILTFPLLRDAHIALMDINVERLDFARTAITKLITEGRDRGRLRRQLRPGQAQPQLPLGFDRLGHARPGGSPARCRCGADHHFGGLHRGVEI